jgi:hypothetical protein
MRGSLRYWFDTEFIDRGYSHPLVLVSIGVVCEDGRTFYRQNYDADLSVADEWTRRNVLRKLSKASDWSVITVLQQDLYRFFLDDHKTVLIGSYPAYDMVMLTQLFGGIKAYPSKLPAFCHDLQQRIRDRGIVPPMANENEHHALSDAIWTKRCWDYLDEIATSDSRLP